LRRKLLIACRYLVGRGSVDGFEGRRLRLVVDGDGRDEALDSVGDELHDDGLAVELLDLAGAVAKGHRAGGPLAAFAQRAFPESAEVEFQALIGTLHWGAHPEARTRPVQVTGNRGTRRLARRPFRWFHAVWQFVLVRRFVLGNWNLGGQRQSRMRGGPISAAIPAAASRCSLYRVPHGGSCHAHDCAGFANDADNSLGGVGSSS